MVMQIKFFDHPWAPKSEAKTGKRSLFDAFIGIASAAALVVVGSDIAREVDANFVRNEARSAAQNHLSSFEHNFLKVTPFASSYLVNTVKSDPKTADPSASYGLCGFAVYRTVQDISKTGNVVGTKVATDDNILLPNYLTTSGRCPVEQTVSAESQAVSAKLTSADLASAKLAQQCKIVPHRHARQKISGLFDDSIPSVAPQNSYGLNKPSANIVVPQITQASPTPDDVPSAGVALPQSFRSPKPVAVIDAHPIQQDVPANVVTRTPVEPKQSQGALAQHLFSNIGNALRMVAEKITHVAPAPKDPVFTTHAATHTTVKAEP